MILRSLVGGLAALFCALATVSPAAAQQGVSNGGKIPLPALGAELTVPAGAGEWTGKQDPAGDLLLRTKPTNPYLSILLSAPTSKKTCGDQMALLARKGFRKLDRLALIPADWSSLILSATASGESTIALCAEKGGKVLMATVTYAAATDAPDLAVVTPMLAAAGRAVLGIGPAPPADKPADKPVDKPVEGGAPVPPADPAKQPPPAEEGDLDPQRLSLPETGLLLVVSSPHEWRAEKDKGTRDLVRRVVPKEPEMKISIEVLKTKRKVGCASILDQHMAATSKGTLESKPRYVPDTWYENAVVGYKGGVGSAMACAELPGGYLLATLHYAGSLDSEDAGSAKPVLVAAYRAASAAIADEAAPRTRFFGGRNMMSPEFFLAGQQVAPNEALGMLENGTTFMLGVRQAGMLPFAKDSAFGLTGRYLLSAGWDTQSGLVIDGLLAIGIGVKIEKKVTLMPMVGTGADAIGTNDTDPTMKTRLDFDFYNYFGVVGTIELTKVVGFEGTFAYCDRGDINEIRWDGRFLIVPASFRKLSVGVSHTDIEDTVSLWQIVLGMGF